jgi:steroid delta-isomerase-like uncharacterized protein
MNLSRNLKISAICLVAAVGSVTAVNLVQHRGAVQLSNVAIAKDATFTPEKNNAQVVKVYNGAWNQGKLELLDEYILPEGLDHSPLSTEKGTTGFKKIVGSFRAAMPELTMTIEDEIYNKDKVVHRWKVQGKHTGAPLFGVPASGKEITLKGISILRLENGKIAERWSSLDQLGLLTQLGVVPPPGGGEKKSQ